MVSRPCRRSSLGILSKLDSKMASTTKMMMASQWLRNENVGLSPGPQPRRETMPMMASVSDGRMPATFPRPSMRPTANTQTVTRRSS